MSGSGSGRGRGRGVELVTDRGCSRWLVDLGVSSSQSASSSPSSSPLLHASGVGGFGKTGTMSRGAFSGLVICVTGLSKEARKQVMEATERLGGQYSPSLHPQCTHLVVQSFGGHKFEHALKHGLRNGLFVVTFGWFVDSVRRNVRLSESLYSVTKMGIPMETSDRFVESKEAENSCPPIVLKHPVKQYEVIEQFRFSERELNKSHSPLFGQSVYIDSDISAELRKKVVEAAACEGAMFLDQWFVGCGASYVVCEESSVQRYLGHADNIVTPIWILKTSGKRSMQRCICISADLARQLGMLLANLQDGLLVQETYCPKDVSFNGNKVMHQERQKVADHAKLMVRSRRLRTMQTCQVPLHPITPSTLLDSICWSISEPTSTATIYTDTSSTGNASEVFFDSRSDEKDVEASFSNLCRPLTESERKELVLRHHFLTILFPVDRFADMGPAARTFFSNEGFTCLQVLDLIYTFYQENMLDDEIKAAIHTDSRHADRLRSAYSSERSTETGPLMYKRIDFLGSRRNFEKLKRVSVDNNSNVYELLIRA